VKAYISGYTDPDRNGRGKGVYVFDYDEARGTLALRQVVEGIVNPSFMAIHPSRQALYCVNGGGGSGVTALAIDPEGTLRVLNRVGSPSPGPTHLAVSPSGRHLVVANYQGGSVAVYPLREDGGVGEHVDFHQHAGPAGPNAARQDMAHAHVAVFDPTGERVLVCDLGLDRTFIYRFDPSTGRLIANDPPWGLAHPGAGPRHLEFHPSGRVLYVINELDSTITTFEYDRDRGAMHAVQVLTTLPPGFSGTSTTAEVVVHPSGRFAYGSNRGDDSLAIFRIDATTGRLTSAGHEPTRGRTPRHFMIDPAGRFLVAANESTGNVVTFAVDSANGGLSATGAEVDAGSPSCVLFI